MRNDTVPNGESILMINEIGTKNKEVEDTNQFITQDNNHRNNKDNEEKDSGAERNITLISMFIFHLGLFRPKF